MRRIYKALPLALLTLALVAASAAPAVGHQQVERPYKSTEAGSVEIGACDDSGFPVIVCPFTTSGESHSTHLGKTTTTSSGTSTLNLLSEPCELFDGTLGIESHNVGTGVFVAANGDALWVSFENTGCADLSGAEAAGPLVGTQTFTGGDGRFAGASGSTTVTGVGQGPNFLLQAVGTLTY